MSKTAYSSLPQVGRMLGVEYARLWYVAKFKGVVKPRAVGRTMLLREEDIAALRRFFGLSPEDQRKTPEEIRQLIATEETKP